MDNQYAPTQQPQPSDELPPNAQIAERRHAQTTEPATAKQLEEVKQEMTGFETATLRWAKIAVILSGLAALFICAQWYEMHTGGQDTHALALAADTQAKKMTDMSTAADKIRQAAEDMVIQDQRIADNSQKAMDASTKQSKVALDASIAAARLDQRAWVTCVGSTMEAAEVGKSPIFTVALQNSGKTVAKRVIVNFHATFSPSMIASLPNEQEPLPQNVQSVGVLAPGARYDNKSPAQAEPKVDETDKARINGTWITYIWGTVWYQDIFKQDHSTKLCQWRKGGEGDFKQCAFHNDAD